MTKLKKLGVLGIALMISILCILFSIKLSAWILPWWFGLSPMWVSLFNSTMMFVSLIVIWRFMRHLRREDNKR